jgi:hypothetical protein
MALAPRGSSASLGLVVTMRIMRWTPLVVAFALVFPFVDSASASWEAEWHRSPAFAVEAVATDGVGNLFVAGFDARGDPAVWVMVLAKYGPNGQRRWITTWRSRAEFYPQARASDVAISRDGRDVFVVGAAVSDSGEALQPRVWAYSRDGTLRWTHRSKRAPHGEWSSITVVPRGFVSAGANDLVRWRRDGVERWHRSFLGVAGDVCEVVKGVAANEGALYAVGFLDRTPTCNDSEGTLILEDADVVIQKRSLAGAVVSSKIYKDAGRSNDVAVSVAVVQRRVFVAGESDDSGWLRRLTPRSRVRWTRRWSLERPTQISASPWGSVYALNDRGDGAALALRRLSYTGELLGHRRTALGRETGSGVATGPGETVAVTARVFSGRGELWRMPG